jgi:hypothetical protein
MNKTKAWCLSIAIVLGIGLTGSQPLWAFTDGACREDAQKLCGDVKPGEGGVRDCLKSHETQLSQGCKDNIAQMKQKHAEMKEKHQEMHKEAEEACKADIQQYCANVTQGEGRTWHCLKAYEDKISVGCKEKMMERKGMRHHK